MEGRRSPELAVVLHKLFDSSEPTDGFELGRNVESLVGHPGWEVIQALLSEVRSRGLQELTQGTRPLEAAQYAQKLGFLNGVQVAQDAAATVISEVEALRQRVAAEIKEREVTQVG